MFALPVLPSDGPPCNYAAMDIEKLRQLAEQKIFEDKLWADLQRIYNHLKEYISENDNTKEYQDTVKIIEHFGMCGISKVAMTEVEEKFPAIAHQISSLSTIRATLLVKEPNPLKSILDRIEKHLSSRANDSCIQNNGRFIKCNPIKEISIYNVVNLMYHEMNGL